MKKLIVLSLVAVLVIVMSAPAALFATGGDNGGNGKCDKNHSGIITSSKREYCDHHNGKGDNGNGKGHCKNKDRPGHVKNEDKPGHHKHHKKCKNKHHNGDD